MISLFPQSRDCVNDGPPTKGEHVSIKWTDGDLYGATFRRVNVKDIYTVSLSFQFAFPYILLFLCQEEIVFDCFQVLLVSLFVFFFSLNSFHALLSDSFSKAKIREGCHHCKSQTSQSE